MKMIEKAWIAKSEDGSAINITAKNNMMLTLKTSPELNQIKVIINNSHGKDVVLYHLLHIKKIQITCKYF